MALGANQSSVRSLSSAKPIDMAVELHGVSFAYGGREGRLVLEEIDLAVRPGEIVGVLGPNGAGKSTLVKLVTGLLAPDRGTVRLGGADPARLRRGEVARKVAVVTQREEVAFAFTSREVVLMGRAPHLGAFGIERPDDHVIAEEAMRSCEVWQIRDRTLSELSGGEQKRVAIARAIAQRAPLLVLDEPTAFLDVHHQIAVMDLVHERVKEASIAALVVLHDLNLAAQYCDRLLLLRDGRTVAHGTVEEVMTYRRVRDTFDVDVYVGVNELTGARFFVPMRKRS